MKDENLSSSISGSSKQMCVTIQLRSANNPQLLMFQTFPNPSEYYGTDLILLCSKTMEVVNEVTDP